MYDRNRSYSKPAFEQTYLLLAFYANFFGLNHVTIIDGQLSATNTDFISLGKYIRLRVVDFHWKIYFEDDILGNLGKILPNPLHNHSPNFNQFSQMFINTNFKPNTILAMLPKLSILGKTRKYSMTSVSLNKRQHMIEVKQIIFARA